MGRKKILRVPLWLREAIKTDKPEDETYSEFLLGTMLPEPSEETRLSVPEDEMGRLCVNEDAHTRVHELAGENVSAAQVLAHYYAKWCGAIVDVGFNLRGEGDDEAADE